MKAAILAKLASQTSLYYTNGTTLSRNRSLASNIDPSWTTHMEYQSQCFAGAAEYWGALAAKEIALQKGSGYGEEIARLIRAETILNQALQHAGKGRLAPSLLVGANAILAEVRKAKAIAENDNRAIYMESIPADSTLAAVGVISMVKGSPFPEYYNNEKPLLKELLPKQVRQANSSYKDQIEKLVMSITAECSKISTDARNRLSAIGLPGSLESYKVGEIILRPSASFC